MRFVRRTAFCGGTILLAAMFCARAFAAGAAGDGADAAGDIEAQYEDVLAALKNPPAHGVLVGEIEPDSPGIAGGLRGDIITEYYGERINTLKDLREQVAEVTARAISDPKSGSHVLLKAYRDGKTVVIQLPRGPLGIRAIEVQAGVPGPRNPPPNLRGTIKFDWQKVLASAGEDSAREAAAFRTTVQIPDDPPDAGFDERWLGWQTMSLEPDGASALNDKVEIHRADQVAAPGTGAGPTTLSFHMLLGDFKTSAPFILDTLTAHYEAEDGAAVSAAVVRVAGTLQANLTTAGGDPSRNGNAHWQTTVPQNAMIQPGIPVVGAALPHEEGAVLALQLLSVQGFGCPARVCAADAGEKAIAGVSVGSDATCDGTCACEPAGGNRVAGGSAFLRDTGGILLVYG